MNCSFQSMCSFFYLEEIEAPVGFEPTNKGFADLRLRPLGYSALLYIYLDHSCPPEAGEQQRKKIKSTLRGYWSGKRDSNPRHQPWQGCALPTELFPQFFHFISNKYNMIDFLLQTTVIHDLLEFRF
jgi:hypothetical protein